MQTVSFLVSASFVLNACSKYILIDEYNATNFIDMFEFFTLDDPGRGYVNYVDNLTALRDGLFIAKESVYIGVDTKSKATGRGRNSIRIHSKKTYSEGLFILDLLHMPGSICSTWPAFWLFTKDHQYPNLGKINIIEGANNQNSNLMAVHSVKNCTIPSLSKEFTGQVEMSNCYKYASGQYYNQGCAIRAGHNSTYGDGFNNVGGGIYTMLWNSTDITIWYFRRTNSPGDITNGQPDPTRWEAPLAKFSGDCEFDQEFKDQRIVFDINFCGDWAGTFWTKDCGEKAQSCIDFVRDNPQEFKETYWLINSLKVYSTRNAPVNSLPTTVSSSIKLYISVGSAVPLLLFILVIFFFIWRHRRGQRERQASVNTLVTMITAGSDLKIDDNFWEIRKENVTIYYDKLLGSGASSNVYCGKITGPEACYQSNILSFDVAVKVPKLTPNKTNKNDFQREIDAMKSLHSHPHLVSLIGYVPGATNPLLILEYCENDNLLNFVQKNKEQFKNEKNSTTLLSFARQTSVGLEYIADCGFIHRDVAARNVFLDANSVCKIGDFGRCRLLESQIYMAQNEKLPIRWMPIEALTMQEYSKKTDVWSFGVLLYELFSLGNIPYPDLKNDEILPFLKSGKRLQQPVCCKDEIYDMMLTCWKERPEDRPNFAQITQDLTNMIEASNLEYGYVDAA